MLVTYLLAASLAVQSTPAVIAPVGSPPADSFGYSLAVSGSHLLVGAIRTGPSGSSGSAHFYRRSPSTGEWVPGLRVPGAGNDRSGWSVAVDADIAAIGNLAPTQRPVRICELDTVFGWAPTASVTYPGNGTSSEFGRAVAAGDGQILVGAPRARDGAGGASGAVYVFENVGGAWTQTGKLLPPSDPATGQIPLGSAFGQRLSLDGDTLAVGAPEARVSGPAGAGRVSLWRRVGGTFTFEYEIESPELPGSFRFGGYGLDVTGDLLAIGSIGTHDGAANGAGMVHTYERSGTSWTELPRVPDPEPSVRNNFGTSVAIDGDRLVVGRDGYFRRVQFGLPVLMESYLRDPGSGGWLREATLNDPHEGGVTYFGQDAVLDGDRLYAGSPFAYVDGVSTGAVYEADVSGGWEPLSKVLCGGGPCSCRTYDPWLGCGNSTWEGAGLSAFGSRSLTRDDLTMTVHGLPPSTMARVLLGPGMASPAAFGDGTLCIQSFRELGPRVAGSDGVLVIPAGLTGRAAAQLGAAGQILAGETWVFQVQYVEPNALFNCRSHFPFLGTSQLNGRPYLLQRGFNLSNAIAVTFAP